ncbi:MAG: hypothetical protein AAF517_10460, partial [Planctomycetota bacterium]
MPVTLGTILSSSDRTVVVASSDGNDEVDPDDHWYVADEDDSIIISRDPTTGFVVSNAHARVPWRSAVSDHGGASHNLVLELDPGEAVRLLHFGAQYADNDVALVEVQRLAALEGRALDGLAPAAMASILNFSFDSDADGIPDHVELEYGLDPNDPGDADGDLDGDGLTNAREFELGTNLNSKDTDGDGLEDGDEVNRGTDPILADTDSDGQDDSIDPFPLGTYLVKERPDFGVSGDEASTTWHVEDKRGVLVVADDFRVALEVDSPARFGSQATVGEIVEGGGTNRVLIRADGGRFELPVESPSEGAIVFRTNPEQGESVTTPRDDVFEDFEVWGGGFTHGGENDLWTRGGPPYDRGPLPSGENVWWIHLREPANAYLETRVYRIPTGSRPVLDIHHVFEAGAGSARLHVSVDGAPFEDAQLPNGDVIWFGGRDHTENEFREISIDLGRYRGHQIALRFVAQMNDTRNGPLWYIDDFRIRDVVEPTVHMLDGAGDNDADGSNNAEEVERGTHPEIYDTDGDGLRDGVETNTGTFNDEDDTGTDPTKADTDGGGVSDGAEIDLGQDPLNALDDRVFRVLVWRTEIRELSDEYPGSLGALRSQYKFLEVVEFDSSDPAEFRATLPGTDIVYFPGQAWGWPGGRSVGESLAKDLQAFVRAGGVIVGSGWGSGDILRGAELLSTSFVGRVGSGGGYETTEPLHPLFRRVDGRLVEHHITTIWRPNDNDLRVLLRTSDGLSVERPNGTIVPMNKAPIVMTRDVGDGVVVLNGYSYFDRDENVDRLLGNVILLVDTDHDGIPDLDESMNGLEFRNPKDAALDLDGDGLSNLDENRLGTTITKPDSDDDGLIDGVEVERELDPLVADTDGDGLLDGDDPFPRTFFRVVIDAGRNVAVTGQAAPLSLRILLDDGELDSGDRRFTLRAVGSAVFEDDAAVGAVVDGGGTSEVLVESSGGRLELGLSTDQPGDVQIEVVDSDSLGIARHSDLFEDFESNDGGFEHSLGIGLERHDPWEWGDPTYRFDSAFSGDKVWATDLDSDYPGESLGWLDTPKILLPSGTEPRLVFQTYVEIDGTVQDGNYGWIEVSKDGEEFERLTGIGGVEDDAFTNYSRDEQAYFEASADLSAFAGHLIRLRFVFLANRNRVRAGWYIDDFEIRGIGADEISFLDADADADGDGLTNGEEIARGTNPHSADTDGDGISDAAETGTGDFVDANDTGTDPLDPDSDDDGLDDLLELKLGLNPNDAGDRPEIVDVPQFVSDGIGYPWELGHSGELRGSDDAFSQSFGFRAGETWLPTARDAYFVSDQRVFLFGPLELDGLELVRQVHIPEDEGVGFYRVVDILSNPSDQAVQTSVDIWARFGFFDRTEVVGTSSGDEIFDHNDGWVATSRVDRADPRSNSSLVFRGSRARAVPRVLLDDESFQSVYDVEIPAKERVAFLSFALRRESGSEISTASNELSSLDGFALRHIPANLRSRIINFSIDTDADGMPDWFEEEHGFDASDPADALVDADDDGLSNRDEYDVGADPHVNDTDGDGWTDGDEVLVRRTDPTSSDTDGDGRPDAVDPFPRSFVIAEFETPYAAFSNAAASVICRLRDESG